MGILAITAGSSKLVSGWRNPVRRPAHERSGESATAVPGTWWEYAWAILVLMIGLQLLFYSE
jgi:hypothetical protein